VPAAVQIDPTTSGIARPQEKHRATASPEFPKFSFKANRRGAPIDFQLA
jgi:hypothetical protein